jgi:hypothetical protein
MCYYNFVDQETKMTKPQARKSILSICNDKTETLLEGLLAELKDALNDSDEYKEDRSEKWLESEAREQWEDMQSSLDECISYASELLYVVRAVRDHEALA